MDIGSIGRDKLVSATAIGLMVLMMLCISNASAAPMGGAFVDANVNGVFDPGIDELSTTIQGAIDNAMPGQTIMVLPGVYEEQLTLTKDGQRIIGSGNDTTSIVAFSPMSVSFSYGGIDYRSIVTVQANDVSFGRLTVDGLGIGTANAGIGFWNSSGALDQVTVRGINDTSNVLGDYSGVIVFTENLNPIEFRMSNSTVYGSLVSDVTIASAYVDAVFQNDRFFAMPGTLPMSGISALDLATLTIDSCQFDDYAISPNAVDPAGPMSAGVRSVGANVTITGCEFDQCDSGVLVTGGSAFVNDSYFRGNLAGVYSESSFTIIQGNSVVGNAYGVYVSSVAGPASHVSISFNEISGNSFGILVKDNGGVTYLEASDNGIHDNVMGAYNDLALEPIHMTHNWWGSITGPGAPGGNGNGDNISTNIDYIPWLNAPYPGGLPITDGTNQVIQEGNQLDPIGVAGIEVSMEGPGSADITVWRYESNPVDDTPFNSADSFVDLMLGAYSGVDQITLRVYYDPLNLPLGIIEDDLRMHWWTGTIWSSCSDTGVDVTSHFVWANFSAGTSPALTQLTGTIFGLGTAIIDLSSDNGVTGSFIQISGSGFTANDNLQVLFGGTPIGVGETDAFGNIIRFGVVIPQALEGAYEITVIASQGLHGSATFTILDDTPITVTLDVGAVHFAGEIISWYATTTINGHLVDVDRLNATLYGPNGFVFDMSSNLTRMSTGIYRITTTIPMDASQGDHAMVLNVSDMDVHFGASVTVFVISHTLTDYGDKLSSIENDTATIITTLGLIRVDLSFMNAKIVSIDGATVSIQTELGVIHASVDQVDATVSSIDGTVAIIHTDLGYVNATLDDIHGKVISIQGTLVTVQTDLGTVKTTVNDIYAWVISIHGTLVTVQTSLGYLNTTVNDIHARVISVQGALVTVQTDLGSINATLNDIHAMVVSIQGTTATIQTDLGFTNTTVNSIQVHVTGIDGDLARIETSLGMITVNVTDINTKIDSLNGTVVNIRTDLGEVQVSLESVNAKIDGLNGTTAIILTDLGSVKSDITDIRLRVISLEGDNAMMMSTLGIIHGTVVSINGTLATVDTNLGEVMVDVGSIQNKANGIDSSTLIGVGISTIMAIIILIVVILRTKKQ